MKNNHKNWGPANLTSCLSPCLKRARAYTPSLEPLNTPLSGPDGNPRTSSFTALGCPVFSGGTEHHTELLLITGRRTIVDFLRDVWLCDGAAAGGKGGGYKNPDFVVEYADLRAEDTGADLWTGWDEKDAENNDEGTTTEESQQEREQEQQETEAQSSPGPGSKNVPTDTDTDTDEAFRQRWEEERLRVLQDMRDEELAKREREHGHDHKSKRRVEGTSFLTGPATDNESNDED